jgi:hypothetical protein
VRDQVLDDGVNYVTASADYVVLTTPSTASITINRALAVDDHDLAQHAGDVHQPLRRDAARGRHERSLHVRLGSHREQRHVPARVRQPGRTYTSVPSGSITVSGMATHINATYMGGQSTASASTTTPPAGTALLTAFRDWPGDARLRRSVHRVGGSGTPFCFGDGSGTACPCSSNAAPGSARMSELARFRRALERGTPSLGNDTVVLHGSGMPNTGSVRYFEGTTQVGGGVGGAFGDGLRCAGGSVVRLGTKINSAGASQFPNAGDPSLSVKGQVTSPGTRHYQAWYRNAAAFCQPETFNLTNGLTIVWNL